jgi:predicted choloylglycine hydrolase
VEDSLIETLFPDFVIPIARLFKRGYLPDQVTIEPEQHHCSTVALRADNGQVFFGRNFDWHHDACLILRAHDPHGLASVSVLDLKYLNCDRDDLDQTTLLQRIPLLFAPYYLMDGMNRHGVAVSDMSADAQPPEVPGKPAIILSTLMRLILDRAKTADEAVALVQAFNVHFVDTHEHLMIADAAGQFRVIEFIDGETRITPGVRSWQVCTNHLLWQKNEEENDQFCSRYRTGSDLAEASAGAADFDDALRITKSMSVEGFTMWSSGYNLTTGDIRIRYKGHEQPEYRDQLPMLSRPSVPLTRSAL